MLARVTEEEKEKIREKALKEERNEEAKKLRREQQKLATHSKGDYGVQTDESMVKWILGKSDKERSQQNLSRQAAILQKSISKHINMRKDRKKQIESEAAIEVMFVSHCLFASEIIDLVEEGRTHLRVSINELEETKQR